MCIDEQRDLAWPVGIPRHLRVYPFDVQLIWPIAARGRPRRRHIPNVLSMPAEKCSPMPKWRTISWRTGTKGKLKAYLLLSVCAWLTAGRSESGTRVSIVAMAGPPHEHCAEWVETGVVHRLLI
jgi:DDE superfamily endonuclease